MLPVALTFAYVVLGVHGLLMLAGIDYLLSGPHVTPAQCFAAVGAYAIRRILRASRD